MATAGYLGLDIGGAGAKAAVYDRAGRMLGHASAPYSPLISSDGHAEIAIEAIYAAARDAVGSAVRQSAAYVVALSIATQGQTFVALDSIDLPIFPAILWYDSRAADEAAQLKDALASTPPSRDKPYVEAIAAAPKVMWLRRHYPDKIARARRYLLLPDYLNYRLTGQPVTDPCTASTTGLYADGAPDYHAGALAAAGIERSALARIQPPGSVVGRVRADLAVEWGLSTQALVITGTNDQYAGALGAGNCRPGILTETTGTCLALVTLTQRAAAGSPPGQGYAYTPGLLSGHFPVEDCDYVLAYAKTAGLVVDWFRRQFARDRSLADLGKDAASVPIGSRGLNVLPHFDGMVSPAPNAAARGAILNLGLSHTRADMYRAVLESIAFCLRENIELMHRCGLSFSILRSIGGGAKSDLWMQIKADITGLPLERPAVTESATLGAAVLAAVGAGWFSSIVDCSTAFYRVGRVFTPDDKAHALYEKPYQTYLDLYRRLYG
ncbi:MAG: FGGY family carbohydrate kinase [Chloroflexi bacterium]|nr:FGGY family carbohydrate kinase [Chloroflexota bacterium]MCL5273558.1 FGGY family carbohydrate kinase [Chloroflexota bacterium]